jgi:hypothetical protein
MEKEPISEAGEGCGRAAGSNGDSLTLLRILVAVAVGG